MKCFCTIGVFLASVVFLWNKRADVTPDGKITATHGHPQNHRLSALLAFGEWEEEWGDRDDEES